MLGWRVFSGSFSSNLTTLSSFSPSSELDEEEEPESFLVLPLASPLAAAALALSASLKLELCSTLLTSLGSASSSAPLSFLPTENLPMQFPMMKTTGESLVRYVQYEQWANPSARSVTPFSE